MPSTRTASAFNFGAERRHHDGFQRLREAIVQGDIGEPKYAFCYWLTDLMKHHSHTIDTLAFLLGDPQPVWAEGRLVLHGDPLDDGSRKGPREGTDMHQRLLPLPTLNVEENRFVPPDGLDFADPLLDFSRVGYDNGAEAVFIPLNRATEFEIHGTEGRAFAWDDGEDIRLRRKAGGSDTQENRFVPSGESPTVNTIRDLVNELETGERTSGNIDVTHRICEAEFGLAWSHVQGSQRIDLPIEGAGSLAPHTKPLGNPTKNGEQYIGRIHHSTGHNGKEGASSRRGTTWRRRRGSASWRTAATPSTRRRRCASRSI